MKRNKYSSIVLVIFVLLLLTCKKEEETKICVHSCPGATPWTVESLDLGLPCFATKDDCMQWAATHGYSNKPCITCD